MLKYLAIALVGVGCSSNDGGGPDAGPASFTRSGDVIDGTAPAGAHVVALWVVTSGADYALKFGDATLTGTQFTLAFAGDPPSDAIDDTGVGTALLAVVTHDVADGTKVVTDADITALGIAGVSTQDEIVWRTPDATVDPTWPGTFSPGYGCGRCVHGGGQNGHDALSIGDCLTADVDLAATVGDVCNLN